MITTRRMLSLLCLFVCLSVCRAVRRLPVFGPPPPLLLVGWLVWQHMETSGNPINKCSVYVVHFV